MSGNTGAVIVLVVVVFAVLFLLPRCIGRVGQEQAGIVERLGRYHRTLPPGVHLLLGPLDRLRRVDLREQRMDMPPQPLIGSDHLIATAGTSIAYQVVDPLRATYEIADPARGLEQLTTTTLRNLVGEIQATEIRAEHRRITEAARRILEETAPRWGLQIVRFELTDVQPPRR